MTLHRAGLPFRPPQAVGPDPALLLRLTRDLTPEQARHLAVLTPRGVTANSAALAQALVFHRFHPVTGQATGGTEGGGLGSLVARVLGGRAAKSGPGPGVPVPCRDEQSGPYRRVYSQPGYAYQSGRVYLPSDLRGELHEAKQAGHGDTAFLYLGGWGGRGGAVDAGVQHGHYMNQSQDDWAPFFLVEQPGGPSAVTVSGERQRGGDPWRLRAGQDAELSFWVTQDAELTVLSLHISGETNLDRAPGQLTLRAPVDPRYGWDAAGGANVLKRMTTIGQRAGQQNLQSGSYLRGANWQASAIGVSQAGAQPWRAEHTGGYCSFPDPRRPEGVRADGQGPKWQVDFRDAGNETDSVYLL